MQERRDWMGLLAQSAPERLALHLGGMTALPAFAWLRAPEVGAVMVQGRAGAVGAPFNLGEASVVRCALRLEDGAVGHAYVQGRDKDHAMRSALVDALMQTERAAEMRERVLEPLAAERAAQKALRAAKAAATRVEFFTMVRGKNA